MVCADLLQATSYDSLGELRFVAVAAQVTQKEMFQILPSNLRCDLGRGVVAKVSVAACDPLFHAPRTSDVILQELHVMVGLEHQDVHSTHPFHHKTGRMPQVCQKTNGHRPVSDDIAHRILSVMRNAEGLDIQSVEIERGSGFEDTEAGAGTEVCCDGIASTSIAINGDFKFNGEHSQALDMVGVLMRDENAIETFGRSTDRKESLTDLTSAQSGVDEQPAFGRFDVSGVAAGAASQDCKP